MFSGQTLYEPYIYQLYNVTFTGLPIMWYALIDFEFTKKEFMQNPGHYKLGLLGERFGTKAFWKWIFYAFFQSVVILALCLIQAQWPSTSMTPSGHTIDFWSSGNFVYAACVLVVNLVLLKMHHNLTGYGEALLLSNALSVFLVVWLENLFPFFTVLYRLWEEFVSSPAAWLGLLLVLSSVWTTE